MTKLLAVLLLLSAAACAMPTDGDEAPDVAEVEVQPDALAAAPAATCNNFATFKNVNSGIPCKTTLAVFATVGLYGGSGLTWTCTNEDDPQCRKNVTCSAAGNKGVWTRQRPFPDEDFAYVFSQGIGMPMSTTIEANLDWPVGRISRFTRDGQNWQSVAQRLGTTNTWTICSNPF